MDDDTGISTRPGIRHVPSTYTPAEYHLHTSLVESHGGVGMTDFAIANSGQYTPGSNLPEDSSVHPEASASVIFEKSVMK